MAISFHCEHCRKKVEAPDSAGSKWGRCPACHKKVYVPSPDSDEELKLAPINTGDLEEQKQLMAETYELTQDILREREVPNGLPGASASASRVSDRELTTHIIVYLRQMADGELLQAQKTTAKIIQFKSAAKEILKKMAKAERPEPELADIAPRVLLGLIKDLNAKLK